MLNLIKKLFLKLFKKQKCFYINGPETLPPPLSKEEEQKIMDELQNGIEDNRELLIIHNLRLVVYIAKKIRKQNHLDRGFGLYRHNRSNESRQNL